VLDRSHGKDWWDGATADTWAGRDRVLAPCPFSTSDFFGTFNDTWRTATTTTLRLQFSRPLAPTTPTLYARVSDLGAIDGSDLTDADIPATVEWHGALLLIRSSQPLRHGRRYALSLSPDNASWGSSIALQDTAAHAVTVVGTVAARFDTPDTLHAGATSDGALLLSSDDRRT